MTVREYLGVYLRGMAMGAADAVPGVSGGTIALITGIYERLVTAITELDPRALALVPGVATAAGRARLRERFVEMDVPFLLALGFGMVTALITVARGVEYAAETAPDLLFAFFFGLIAASAVVLRDEVDVSTSRRALAGVAGVAIAVLTASQVSGALPNSLPVVFVVGAIAVSAMVLPGVSGSLILLLLGQYEFLTGTLSTFVDGVADLAGDGTVGALVEPGTVVVTFGVGAVVGVLSVAHAVKFALRRFREATLTFLVALMVGALYYPAEQVALEVGAWTPTATLGVLGAGAVGAGLVLAVDHVTGDIDIGGDETDERPAPTAK
jgi:putative membrane protein